MAVYVDDFYVTGAGNFGRMKMSHMVADSTVELIAMAEKIGVNKKWIQDAGTNREHFDVCMSARKKALTLGVNAVGFRDLARMTGNRADNNSKVNHNTLF